MQKPQMFKKITCILLVSGNVVWHRLDACMHGEQVKGLERLEGTRARKMNGYSTNIYVLLKHMVPYSMKVTWIFFDTEVRCTLLFFCWWK